MANLTGTKRIEKRFKDLKKAGRTGLVTFITAGDPNNAPFAILKPRPIEGPIFPSAKPCDPKPPPKP